MTVGWPPPAPTSGQNWQLSEVQRLIRTGVVDNTGAGRVTFPAVDAGRRLEIVRAVVSCSGVVVPQPSCRLYVLPDGANPAQQYDVSGTANGLFDEADYPGDGLWVLEGEQLLALWSNAIAGQSLAVNVQARLMARS